MVNDGKAATRHSIRWQGLFSLWLLVLSLFVSQAALAGPVPQGTEAPGLAFPAAPPPPSAMEGAGGPAAPMQHPAKARLLEPHLHVARGGQANHPRVALTFDACMGEADARILSTLVEERIPATIFVTARFLRRNPAAVAVFKANADLFEIENHGENHVPTVTLPLSIYGIAAAGSPEAVAKEVDGGAAAMIKAGIAAPHWFRGATAKYDPAAISEIRGLGYRIAGYSLNGDGGSLLGAAVTEKRIASARDGDVIIAHINQPTHAAGDGVARALKALKARGTAFVRLADVEDLGDDNTVN